MDYKYRAYVKGVYDGDTITCDIDCGFGIKYSGQKIRLYGINTPELRGEDRLKGIEVRDVLREKILGKWIILKTLKDKKGKYGRYLGIILKEENGELVNINKWLKVNGYAHDY